METRFVREGGEIMKLRKLLHGEVIMFETKTLPKGLKPVEVKNNYLTVGESETQFNDHRVAVEDKLQVKFYEDAEGRLFMVNTAPTQIFCPRDGKHAAIEIPASVWEVDKAKEYDYVNNQVREVQD